MREQDAVALPRGWAMARLNDLGTWSGGGTPSKANNAFWTNGTIPWVSPKDMKFGRIRTAEDFITEEAVDQSSAKYIPANSILMVTRSGILAHTFPVAVNECVVTVNQDLKSLTPFEIVEPDFLSWYLRAQNFQILKECAKHGTTVASIDTDRLKKVSVPVAPLNEQRRIVEKIETLFARLDQGEAALRHTQTLLARYRQSVLKAAVTGALTADWRAQNAHRLEHGRDLLARILQTRRETWQGRGKYQEPAAPDTSNLPELPEGWVWASFGQLFQVFGGATPSRRVPENWQGDIPWVSSGEVAFCRIKGTNEKITKTGLDSCSTKVHPVGTVLLAMIGEGKTRGQAAILDVPACNNQNAAAIRVAESGVPPEYIYYFLMGHYEESRKRGQGGNQPALNGEKVKRFNLPLPSLEEAKEIIDRIDNALTSALVVDGWCQSELTRSAALRQSILKDAFAGKLVPQDPSDEPAAELLDRIRASRTAMPRNKARA